jgi:predicted nucleotidyltransferase
MVADFAPLEATLSEYIADVQSVLPLKKAYLFGSYAKGIATSDSDIDLCFFTDSLDEAKTIDTLAQLLGLARKYYTVASFEPHVFSVDDLETDNPLIKEVLRTGQEIPLSG